MALTPVAKKIEQRSLTLGFQAQIDIKQFMLIGRDDFSGIWGNALLHPSAHIATAGSQPIEIHIENDGKFRQIGNAGIGTARFPVRAGRGFDANAACEFRGAQTPHFACHLDTETDYLHTGNL
jgi:hypothetical protein